LPLLIAGRLEGLTSSICSTLTFANEDGPARRYGGRGGHCAADEIVVGGGVLGLQYERRVGVSTILD